MYVIIFIAVIGLIVYRKKIFEKNRKSEEEVITPELNERIDLLLKELSRIGIPIKDEYISSKEAAKIGPENLKKILTNILKHLNMEGHLSLKYYSKEESEKKGMSCGKIELVEDKIILNQIPKYSMKDYRAEMIHICVGRFIKVNKFKEIDESVIGKNTDILAVLLGFGKHLHLYKEMSSTEQIISPYKASKLGYLSSLELEFVQSRYSELYLERMERDKEQKRSKEIEDRAANTKVKLKKKIDSLRLSFEKNEGLIKEAIVIDSSKIDKGDVKSLSDLTSKYRDRVYEGELDELEKKYKDPEKKNEVIVELDKLNERLIKDSFLISKYQKK